VTTARKDLNSNRLMSYNNMERKFEYLINNRVIWRRDPVTDIPDIETDKYLFYKDGTYQCYNLFRSKAKITTYRSLKWHMLVLWYLNPDWNKHEAMDIAMYITGKQNGFVTFNINRWNVARLIDDLSILDLEVQPTNKLRKIIFKWNCGLTKSEKLSIVGQLIGRMNGIKSSDIYEAMLQINYEGDKIIISRLAKMLNVTSRTIYRRMDKYPALKEEKKLLNTEI
tara:strand:- start:141 stop:815 length:675 start_codon:yes stop_codon:yes gene_type:complete